MAELLFWVGPDKILYGSDYGIWTPKWLIDKFMEFEIPDEMTREPAPSSPSRTRRRSSASMPRASTMSISRRRSNKIGAAGGYAHLTAARAAE